MVCDREADPAGLRRLLCSGRFDAVVDYCAMTPGHIAEAVAAFRATGAPGRFRQYIFISTNIAMDLSVCGRYVGLELHLMTTLEELWHESHLALFCCFSSVIGIL